MGAGMDGIGTVYKEQEVQLGMVSEYEKEVAKRAAELGLNSRDPVSWGRFSWIAEEFYKAPLPEPWSAYADDHGQVFYYDHQTGESVWSHPLLQTFRNLYLKCQEEPYLHNYYRDLFNNLRQYSDQTKGWWALNLLASPNSGPPPTPEEVLDMASYLGIAPRKEYHLMWVAKQAVQVALPPNWEELEDNEGNVYFYDKATGKSSIKHPMDDYFFALVQEERRKTRKRQAAGKELDTEAELRARWLPFVEEATGAAYFYSFAEGVRLDYPPWEQHYQSAAVAIQRHFRRHRKQHNIDTQAAITIQRIYRGYVVRDAVNAWKRECAALCIQTTWRMYWASKNFFKVLAAIHIQRAFRHHLARRGVQKAMAAMRIQRAQRLHAAKNELRTARDRRDAAQALQKVWRGRVGRRVAKRRKYEKRVQERVKLEIEAAIKLQKVQRGRVGRRRAAVLREKRDRELAAVILQAAWRGREGRKLAESMRRESAAAQVQKHFRAYRARTDFKRHKAARIIQAKIRGFLARKRLKFMKLHKETGYHNAATTIQRHWRGYHCRRSRATNAAAVKIQAHWRGCYYRMHTKRAKAATKIQSTWKGSVVHKRYAGQKRLVDLIALRLQFLYRRMIARRRKIIARIMQEYKEDMASVIRATWLAYKARKQFLVYLANKDKMEASATRIQAVWKGAKARRRYNLMRDKDAWAAYNATVIQTNWRRIAAASELVRRRARLEERCEIIDQLRPLYIEMYSLPDKVVRPSGHKLLDKLIIQDVCKDMPDILGEKAVRALRNKIASLHKEKEIRIATLDKTHHTLSIHWRLMELPEERWLELPPAGAPSWVSNKVVKKCRAELERVKKLRVKALQPLAREAWRNLEQLRNELGMTDKWRKRLQYYDPPDESLVDSIVEQLRVLEDLYIPLSPLVPLVQHLEGHIQMQDDMLAATDPIAAAAAKQKALKRLSKHEAKIAEMQEEFPSLVSETLERLHQLEHMDHLPIPVEEVYEMFGLPTEEELTADMERYMMTKTGRSNSEAVLRSIIHFRKMKKLTAGDAKAKKKKKKAARDLDCGDRPGSGRSSKQGSPMLGKQLSTRKSSMAVPSHEVVMGGVSEQAHRPGSNGHGEAPDGVRRRPARRKGKKAVAA